MTAERNVEPILRRWLVDGVDEMPERVYVSILDRVERQPQRRAWRVAWRNSHVNTYLKPIVAIAAVLVVTVAGFALLSQPSSSNPGGAADSPLPSPSGSASPATRGTIVTSPTSSGTPVPSREPRDAVQHHCGNGAPTCNFVVEAGAHPSLVFKPAFTYSVPDDWMNPVDVEDYFELFPNRSGGTTFGTMLGMSSDQDISDWMTGCSRASPRAGGAVVHDWIEVLSSEPSLEAGTPQPVVIGGAEGQRVDLREVMVSNEDCQMHLTNLNQPVRVAVLDVGGSIVVIVIHSTMSADPDLAAAVRRMQPFLNSLRFVD